MRPGTFFVHISSVLRRRLQKHVSIFFLFSATWAPHGRHESNGSHAAGANHLPKRAQILERGACHAYMSDRMKVDQAGELILLLFIRDTEPVCQVFQHVTVAAVGVVEAWRVDEMDL